MNQAIAWLVSLIITAGAFGAMGYEAGELHKNENPAALSQVSTRWEVREVNTLEQVQELADNGWEPYASYNDNDANQHMLRKRVSE